VNDLTLLYYTANRIDGRFAAAVRDALGDAITQLRDPVERDVARAHGEPPIVAVSQGSAVDAYRLQTSFVNSVLDVGDKPTSIWQVYQNILIGAKAASTPFVACCEDDTVYAPSHFTYRPALDTFAYDRNRWVITKRLHPQSGDLETIFYWRQRHQMAMCIATRELLIETLEEKFAKYPVPPPSTDVAKKAGWGEPGATRRTCT
jgi:hypothetical protein